MNVKIIFGRYFVTQATGCQKASDGQDRIELSDAAGGRSPGSRDRQNGRFWNSCRAKVHHSPEGKPSMDCYCVKLINIDKQLLIQIA